MSGKSALSNANMPYHNHKLVIRQELDESYSDTTSDDYDGEDDDGSGVDTDHGVDVDDTGSKETMWLGFVEKAEKRSSLLRHSFPSKAGGTPAWLDPVHLPTGKSYLCDFCEEPLQFVLQVYAPINIESAQHRMFFVFMCPSMTCLRKDQHEQQKKANEARSRSVKVFRCQLPLLNPFYKLKNHHNNGSTHSQLEAPLCSWCGTWKGNQLCSGCRRVCYCSKKHQILHWRSHHKDDCNQLSNSSLHDGKSASAKIERASNSLWHEYEIVFGRRKFATQVSECGSSLVSECNDTSSSLMSIQGMDGNMKSTLEDLDGENEKKSLASFAKHISEDPAQVLRCWVSDGKPLWPESHRSPSTANIPQCTYCNGSLRFEFQIMPQLLYYFGVENEVDSLDWATIAIYTCNSSCDSNVAYMEEFPLVQLYS